MKTYCLRSGPFGIRCHQTFETLWEGRGPGNYVLLGWSISCQSKLETEKLVRANNQLVFLMFFENPQSLVLAAQKQEQERLYGFLEQCDQEDPPIPQWLSESLDELTAIAQQ